MDLGNRIMILGSAGSGKSTLAKGLGTKLGIPPTHLDTLYWKPNWTDSTDEEFFEKVNEVIERDSWIIDGSYSRAYIDLRFQRATCIIYLDFSRLFCIYRVIKRRIKYRNKTRPDMAEGCPEKIDREFLSWIWNYPKRSRQKTLDKISHYCENGDKLFLHLKKRKDIKKLLDNLSENN